VQATTQDAATSWGLRIPSVLELSRGSGINGATLGGFREAPALQYPACAVRIILMCITCTDPSKSMKRLNIQIPRRCETLPTSAPLSKRMLVSPRSGRKQRVQPQSNNAKRQESNTPAVIFFKHCRNFIACASNDYQRSKSPAGSRAAPGGNSNTIQQIQARFTNPCHSPRSFFRQGVSFKVGGFIIINTNSILFPLNISRHANNYQQAIEHRGRKRDNHPANPTNPEQVQ
jgi:hypothetical protein